MKRKLKVCDSRREVSCSSIICSDMCVALHWAKYRHLKYMYIYPDNKSFSASIVTRLISCSLDVVLSALNLNRGNASSLFANPPTLYTYVFLPLICYWTSTAWESHTYIRYTVQCNAMQCNTVLLQFSAIRGKSRRFSSSCKEAEMLARLHVQREPSLHRHEHEATHTYAKANCPF